MPVPRIVVPPSTRPSADAFVLYAGFPPEVVGTYEPGGGCSIVTLHVTHDPDEAEAWRATLLDRRNPAR